MGPGSRSRLAGATVVFVALVLCRRIDHRFGTAEFTLTPKDVKPGGDDNGGTERGMRPWHIAEHDVTEHHGPEDHRILVRHHAACGREFQRAIDAKQRGSRDRAGSEEQTEMIPCRRKKAERCHHEAEYESPEKLRRSQNN